MMTDFDYHPKWDQLIHDKDLRQKYEEHLFDECVAHAKEKLDYFNYLVNNLNIPKKEAMNVLGIISDADLENYKNLIAIADKKQEEKTMTTYTLPKEFQDQFEEKYWEQTDDQLDKLVKSESYEDRALAACFGRDKDLDILVKDPDWTVRQTVAEWGRPQDLDILVHDEDPAVVKTVIHSGRGKDLIYILLNEYDDEIVLYAASMFRRRFGKHTETYMDLFD